MAALCRLGVRQNPILPILRRAEVSLITGQVDSGWLVVPGVYRGFDFATMAKESVGDRDCTILATSDYGERRRAVPAPRRPVGPAAGRPTPATTSAGTTTRRARPPPRRGAMHTDSLGDVVIDRPDRLHRAARRRPVPDPVPDHPHRRDHAADGLPARRRRAALHRDVRPRRLSRADGRARRHAARVGDTVLPGLPRRPAPPWRQPAVPEAAPAAGRRRPDHSRAQRRVRPGLRHPDLQPVGPDRVPGGDQPRRGRPSGEVQRHRRPDGARCGR